MKILQTSTTNMQRMYGLRLIWGQWESTMTFTSSQTSCCKLIYMKHLEKHAWTTILLTQAIILAHQVCHGMLCLK